MVAEAIEEYALESEEASYEEPGEHKPMIFIASEVEYHDDRNASHWLDHKHPIFPSLN